MSWQRTGGGQGTRLLALRLGLADSIMHKDQPVITGEMGGDSREQFTFCLGASWETKKAENEVREAVPKREEGSLLPHTRYSRYPQS